MNNEIAMKNINKILYWISLNEEVLFINDKNGIAYSS